MAVGLEALLWSRPRLSGLVCVRVTPFRNNFLLANRCAYIIVLHSSGCGVAQRRSTGCRIVFHIQLTWTEFGTRRGAALTSDGIVIRALAKVLSSFRWNFHRESIVRSADVIFDGFDSEHVN